VIALLRQTELFDGVDERLLEDLAATGQERELAPGDVLVAAGDAAAHFIVHVEGRVDWTVQAGAESQVMSTSVAPGFAGATQLLTGESVAATGRAQVPTRVVAFDGEAFRRVLAADPEVTRRVARLMRPVFERVSGVIGLQERLAGLGRLAAGLAHELNNPAAAARRSAKELEEVFRTLQDSVHAFVSSGVEREEAARLVELQREALAQLDHAPVLDAVTRADREDALAALLEQRGLDGYRLAEPLVAAGVTEDWLQRMCDAAGETAFPAAVAWVVASLEAGSLAHELHDATMRISDLVGAVKEYAYMDRDEVQEVDLHKGLETTLKILGHRLKHGDVRIERMYDAHLPLVRAHGSQLNQVWTNLLDNAIDAVDGDGTIELRTCLVGDEVLVEVSDDGPGVPPDVRDRIFEPFFTTKDVGQGSGLGLDISRRIVVEGHGGQLRLDSRPGRTTFQVRLPIRTAT